MNFKYLIVEGCIGAGKTTLAEKLAECFKAKQVMDLPWKNPHLEAFYERKQGAAFRAQLFFLAQRVAALKELTRNFPEGQCVVSDFLLEKDKVFANINLNDDELLIYKMLFDAVSDYMVQPDVVIYLKAPLDVLVNRVLQRNKAMELRITPAYLSRLMEAYEHFFYKYQERMQVPVLIIDNTNMDVFSSGNDVEELANFLRSKPLVGIHYYMPTAKR